MKEKNFDLITKMWAPLALEYAKFLSRYKLDVVTAVTGWTYLGYQMSVFADGDEYMNLTLTNETFNKEEAQITELLNIIEELIDMLLAVRGVGDKYGEECNEGYDYMDYDDEEDY